MEIKKKSKPSETAVECWKCNGTGFYCMGIENGKPFSTTGFDCIPCGGSGWLDGGKLSKVAQKALDSNWHVLDFNRINAENSASDHVRRYFQREGLKQAGWNEVEKMVYCSRCGKIAGLLTSAKSGKSYKVRVNNFGLTAGRASFHACGNFDDVSRVEGFRVQPEAEAQPSGGFVGSVGDKIETSLTIQKMKSLSGNFGGSLLVTLADDQGNRFQIKTGWATSFADAVCRLHEGDTIQVAAKIKDHDRFNGVAFTRLANVKVK